MTYTAESIKQMNAKALAGYKRTREFIYRLNRLPSGKLDNIMRDQHNQEFRQINCLECANCCKTISPGIYYSDIKRLGIALKMKVTDIISTYLVLDDEGVYGFKQTPCPFLDENNYCAIYESRPKACREYPHTNRKRFYQLFDITALNTKVCPAVFNIIERLKLIFR